MRPQAARDAGERAGLTTDEGARLTKLKLGPLADDKQVKLTLELPAALHRDLVAYGEILGREAGQPSIPPGRLIVPMLERFIELIATNHGFAKARRVGGGCSSDAANGRQH